MKNNVSVIAMFYLSGLNETTSHRWILFFLTLLCYCIIFLVNVSLIVTIILDNSLHEPMYILVCVFCMNGLYGTTGFFPKFLWDLLSPVHVISYPGCLVQAYVIYSFLCSDVSILAVMAYDRYLAICRPLEYHTVMSKPRLIKLVCFSWITPFCAGAINNVLASRLQLCSSYISKLFCVNWVIVALACFPSETVVNNIVTFITIFIYVLHGFFIIWSYIYLIKTCVSSIENRAKFMQTCVPHLTSLLTFLVTVLFDVTSMRVGSVDLQQFLQTFVVIQCFVILPLMNPLMYGFKLTKIRNKILRVIALKCDLKH